jgi:hypothetical protein
MRVIPGNATVCSASAKSECIMVFFEKHEDWDDIVDAALAARNLGWKKGVSVQELKEALFPPGEYAGRYM